MLHLLSIETVPREQRKAQGTREERKETEVNGIIPQETVFRVGRWTRHDVAATPETILSVLTQAHMSCTFGYDEPPLVRMGKGFHDTLISRINLANRANGIAREELKLDLFMGARVLLDDRFDSWMCHIFMWDRETYELPILFVVANVKLVDGQ
jgi:hypothetical protein